MIPLTEQQAEALRALRAGSLPTWGYETGAGHVNKKVAHALIAKQLAQWVGSYGAIGLTAYGRAELMARNERAAVSL